MKKLKQVQILYPHLISQGCKCTQSHYAYNTKIKSLEHDLNKKKKHAGILTKTCKQRYAIYENNADCKSSHGLFKTFN